MPIKNNILLRKRAVPKKFTLPNGRTFSAKYERVKRTNVPRNVRIARTHIRKIGPRRQRRCVQAR